MQWYFVHFRLMMILSISYFESGASLYRVIYCCSFKILIPPNISPRKPFSARDAHSLHIVTTKSVWWFWASKELSLLNYCIRVWSIMVAASHERKQKTLTFRFCAICALLYCGLISGLQFIWGKPYTCMQGENWCPFAANWIIKMSEKNSTTEILQGEEIRVWTNIEVLLESDLPAALHLHLCFCAT